jgi:hypothetical protein
MVAHSYRDSLGAAGDIQLAKNVTDVGFDSGRADDQLFGDFGIVYTFNHQSQHGALALCQVVA